VRNKVQYVKKFYYVLEKENARSFVGLHSNEPACNEVLSLFIKIPGNI
jgi:hypothetical protein